MRSIKEEIICHTENELRLRGIDVCPYCGGKGEMDEEKETKESGYGEGMRTCVYPMFCTMCSKKYLEIHYVCNNGTTVQITNEGEDGIRETYILDEA